ncbi:hypothetical protein Tco_1219206 [Tanacetum coccineum]
MYLQDKLCEIDEDDEMDSICEQMKSKLDASTNVLAAETKSESMTDEKMQEVTKELLNIRISQMDVGKAVEICYRDPVRQ